MTMRYIEEQVKKARDRDLAEQHKAIYEAMIILLEQGRVQKPDGEWISVSSIKIDTRHLLVLNDMWKRAKAAESKVDYLQSELAITRERLSILQAQNKDLKERL